MRELAGDVERSCIAWVGPGLLQRGQEDDLDASRTDRIGVEREQHRLEGPMQGRADDLACQHRRLKVLWTHEVAVGGHAGLARDRGRLTSALGCQRRIEQV